MYESELPFNLQPDHKRDHTFCECGSAKGEQTIGLEFMNPPLKSQSI